MNPFKKEPTAACDDIKMELLEMIEVATCDHMKKVGMIALQFGAAGIILFFYVFPFTLPPIFCALVAIAIIMFRWIWKKAVQLVTP
jgi:hypothetical protein